MKFAVYCLRFYVGGRRDREGVKPHTGGNGCERDTVLLPLQINCISAKS